MKRLILKLISFFSSRSFWKYFVLFLIYVLAFAGLMCLLTTSTIDTVLGTVIGLITSGAFLYFAKLCFSYLEDLAKVSGNTKELAKIYTNENYLKTVTLNNTKCTVIYNAVLMNNDFKFEVKDSPNKHYELPEFAGDNLVTLLDAHSSSTKLNCDTVRLDDVKLKDGKYIFYLSRSNFYNHLVTNRAIDFEITKGVTIRSMYEYGPEIKPLKDSVLSNHIGINALVFLNDGTMLIPRRKNDSTISKNMVTSSIAVRLNPPKDKKKKITKDYLFKHSIISNLTARLKIAEEDAQNLSVKIDFLGLGQNIYEGGKPQMYFAVYIENLNKEEYIQLKAKVKKQEGKIDTDKCIYLANFNSIKFAHGEKIHFSYFNEKKKKTSSCTVGYEKSFICNIWHYLEKEKQNKN